MPDPLSDQTANSFHPGCILLSGGTGFVGRHLTRRLLQRGTRVLVYTRSVAKAAGILGSAVEATSDLEQIAGTTRIDALVNLAGLPIMGFPWTRERRRQLLDSRVRTTNALTRLVRRLEKPPATLISASAIGYYGVRGEETLDESAAPTDEFQSVLCQQWEQAALQCESAATRVTRLRLGVVLGRDGGALPQLLRPARFGMGAILGGGRQWVSWIHIEDLLGLVELALGSPGCGPVLNATSPHPVRQADLQREIATALHRPLWLHVPAPPMRLLLGELSQLLLEGQRVIPARALQLGFPFRYADIAAALSDLVKPSA
jgi:uncharacterized protein